MAQQGFMAPGAYDADSEQIRRRMAYAEMLGQQSQQAPKGQMVGGHFVAPSWTEHAANLLKAYGSGRGQESAMRDMQGLSDRRQGDSMATMQKYGDLLQGTPAQTLQPATAVDDEGNANSPVNVPAQAGNKQAALAQLLQSRDPMLQQFGMQQMMKGPDKPMVVGRSLMTPEGKVIGTDSTWQAEQQAGREAKAAELQLRLEDQRLSREERAATARELQQIRLDSARDLKTLAGSMKPPPTPFFQPVQTANGVMSFNGRTGQMEPINVGGKAVIGAAADPKLQGSIAQSKAGGTVAGKDQAESNIELPKVIQQGEETVKLVDDLLAAPGFKQAVGGSRVLQIQRIPGTAAKDFDIRLDQLKGKQFLQAFESLKGGGQITEVEGKKATEAIARMDAAGTEEGFTKAAREFQTIIRQGVARAKQKAGGTPSIDDLLKQYGGQ